jgi:hypothetical protein
MVRLAAVVLALALCLVPVAGANASPRQLTILQDDQVFMGWSRHDPDQAMAEAKALGADAIRTTLTWEYVSPRPHSNRRPEGFDVADPDSRGYDWTPYDRLIRAASRNGLKVLVNVSGSLPHWASEQPRRCQSRCVWKPRPDLFGQFVEAVARRYGPRVWMYSVWNEPNLGSWLLPQARRTRFGVVDVAGKAYRQLWLSAWRAVARSDPAKRNRVLFGETAAIAEPIPTLLSALCLDPLGRPYRGRLRRLQGCSHPRRLRIGGIAHHPYNKSATGSWHTRTRIPTSLSIAYLWRLRKLMRTAARRGRIPGGRGIWVTEFGFQSRPPDRRHGLGLRRQARQLNESERLFFADRSVRAIAQFELFDAPVVTQYNTGLRFKSGRRKPAYDAFRLPLVVTRLSRNRVEVWGCARPSNGRRRVEIYARRRRGRYRLVARRRTNPSGYFRVQIRRRDAARLVWRVYRTRVRPAGVSVLYRSRAATAGGPIHYLR